MAGKKAKARAVSDDKQDLIRQLCESLLAQERAIDAAAQSASDAATHEETQPETDKDTFALEASYLAGAHAARVRELRAIQKVLKFLPLRTFGSDDPIDLSALIELEVDGRRTKYFLAPHGGGTKLHLGKILITVITPESPLGQKIVEKIVGDEIETPGGVGEIVDVR